jgi:hypothetical protein
VTAHAWRRRLEVIGLGILAGAAAAGWTAWRSLAATEGAERAAVATAPTSAEQRALAIEIETYHHLRDRLARCVAIHAEFDKVYGMDDIRGGVDHSLTWSKTTGTPVAELDFVRSIAFVTLNSDDPVAAVALARELKHQGLLQDIDVHWGKTDPAAIPPQRLSVAGYLPSHADRPIPAAERVKRGGG